MYSIFSVFPLEEERSNPRKKIRNNFTCTPIHPMHVYSKFLGDCFSPKEARIGVALQPAPLPVYLEVSSTLGFAPRSTERGKFKQPLLQD